MEDYFSMGLNKAAFMPNQQEPNVEALDYGLDFAQVQGRSQTLHESRSRKCSHQCQCNVQTTGKGAT